MASSENQPIYLTTPEQKEEHRRVRAAGRVIDVACWLIENRSPDFQTAQLVVTFAKDKVLELFPDCEAQFDLIYLPRLRRKIGERFPTH
jgi:hypothetical protein